MLSMMTQEEMTRTLEKLLPTEAPLLRDPRGLPIADRGVLAMLLILAKDCEEHEYKIKRLEKYIKIPYEYTVDFK